MADLYKLVLFLFSITWIAGPRGSKIVCSCFLCQKQQSATPKSSLSRFKQKPIWRLQKSEVVSGFLPSEADREGGECKESVLY
jgi:hypothetical protein